MVVWCSIDGVDIGGEYLKEATLHDGVGEPCLYDGRNVSETERRLFRFAAPVRNFLVNPSYSAQSIMPHSLQVLTEDMTPTLKMSNISTISITFQRGNYGTSELVERKKKEVVPDRDAQETTATDLLVGKINEVQKLNFLVGSVTA
jgi:hypothetical protein